LIAFFSELYGHAQLLHEAPGHRDHVPRVHSPAVLSQRPAAGLWSVSSAASFIIIIIITIIFSFFFIFCFDALAVSHLVRTQVERKRHIGNDITAIVFIDAPAHQLDPRIFVSEFLRIFLS
jgi:hypothetical protein